MKDTLSIPEMFKRVYSIVSAILNDDELRKEIDADEDIYTALSYLEFEGAETVMYKIISVDNDTLTIIRDCESNKETILDSKYLLPKIKIAWLIDRLLIMITFFETMKAKVEDEESRNMLDIFSKCITPLYLKVKNYEQR